MKEHQSIPLPDYVELDPDTMRQRAKEFFMEIRLRHTVRAFSNRQVPRDIIENCIRAAGTAPSGANHQPWHFALISDDEVKKEVRAKAEEEEKAFYAGRAGEEWLDALDHWGQMTTNPILKQHHG